jgi:hypothetical protein
MCLTETRHSREGLIGQAHWPKARNIRDRHDLFVRGNCQSGTFKMNKDHSKGRTGTPVVWALAVAIFGVLAMLIVDHGPWNRPRVQTAEMVNHPTTGAAAQAVGATVTPTAPRPQLEPAAPGPKPAQPAIPAPEEP